MNTIIRHAKAAAGALSAGRMLFVILGGALQAAGVANIHAYSGVTEGGVIGLTLLIHYLTGVSPALSSLVLDGACYLFGYKTLGGTFLIYSAASAGAYSLCYALLEPFAPLSPGLVSSPFFSAVAGALFVGVGAGLCILGGGATGGDDALAMSVDKKRHCGVRTVYLVSDVSVLLLSLVYIPLRKIAYSLFTVILSGLIVGVFDKAGKKYRKTGQALKNGPEKRTPRY